MAAPGCRPDEPAHHHGLPEVRFRAAISLTPMTGRMRDIIKSLGRAFRQRLNDAEKLDRGSRRGRASRIGMKASRLWVEEDLPHHTGREVGDYGQSPSTVVTGGSGRRRMFDAVDATIAGKHVAFELKRSNGVYPLGADAYEEQKAAHLIDLALGSWGADYYVRIYGLNGYAEVWTRRAAERTLNDTGSTVHIPAPSEPPIRFAPDVVTPK